MSQRNPMNDRYQSDERKGTTRKSAASAKPKSKAAATVMTASPKKSPKERKAMQKEARNKERERQREMDRKYYKPDTERYKKLRRSWWMCLVGAVVCVGCSWLLRGIEPSWIAMVTLFAAYALIILAFYIDFSKIRKERQSYQVRMMAKEAAEEKAAKQAARKQKSEQGKKGKNAKAAEKPEEKPEEQPEEKPAHKGFFGRNKAVKAEAE